MNRGGKGKRGKGGLFEISDSATSARDLLIWVSADSVKIALQIGIGCRRNEGWKYVGR